VKFKEEKVASRGCEEIHIASLEEEDLGESSTPFV